MVKISYPNGFQSKDKYIKSLEWEYAQSDQFDSSLIITPVKKISSIILSIIEQAQDEEILGVMENIRLNLDPNYVMQGNLKVEVGGNLHRYSRGEEGLIRRLLGDDFPDDRCEEYLQTVSNITKDLIFRISQVALEQIFARGDAAEASSSRALSA